ncbi:MAG: rhomboid family intramembrane serine protease [Filimonas sp.]|nr:rhomboid family intramembrane serine protease [Filimonas sp.]
MASSHTGYYELNGLDISQFSTLLFESAHSLQWQMTATSANSFDIHIPKTAWKPGGIIVVTVENGLATLLSKNSDALLGGSKRNAGNLETFINALNEQRGLNTPETLTEKFNTAVAKQEAYEKDLAERMQSNNLTGTEKMRLGVGGRKVTYTLVGINVFVFIMMVVAGAGFVNFTVASLIKWGGNIRFLTANGDWFRLITNVFQHGGVIHLLFNMYALISVGIFLEPLLGKWRYLTVYLACGILASLTSIWWSGERVSVGASGAIFGLYGVFLALLTTNHLEKSVRNSLLQSIGVFVLYNLVYGMKGGIDNAAHIGGLVSGFVFGYVYYYFFISKKDNASASMIITAVATIVITALVLPTLKDDSAKFQHTVDRFIQQEGIATKPLDGVRSDTFSIQNAEQLNTVSLPIWRSLKASMDSTGNYNLSVSDKKRRDILAKYAGLRLRQTELLIKRENEKSFDYDNELQQINKDIEKTLDVSE